ncbi:hypothetical protein ANCCAN_19670 [Ancylostoma caninum]|uniref:Uncharacterized protein n=1 Tax=Ancylostoma caninum TaxID=29170 RepID=A0A368FQQ2_ANCCA|nr:hypothetical protein ANCCAN_19670 [Ancylostoma caninum]
MASHDSPRPTRAPPSGTSCLTHCYFGLALKTETFQVTQRYQFGIPEVRADCICECNAASDKCTAETHQYTQCPEDPNRDFLTSCYRTFLPNQSPIGCPAGSNAKLCCDVKFRPYR